MDNTETDTETAAGHLDNIYVNRHGHRRDSPWTTQTRTDTARSILVHIVVAGTGHLRYDTDTEETDNVDTARDTATEPMMDDEVVIV